MVTDADRERAATFLESWEPGPEMTVVKLGREFAAHREAAERAERAVIVEWLRGTRWLENAAAHAKTFAHDIERGDYETTYGPKP